MVKNVCVKNVVVPQSYVLTEHVGVIVIDIAQFRTIKCCFVTYYQVARYLYNRFIFTYLFKREHSGISRVASTKHNWVLNFWMLDALLLAPIEKLFKLFLLNFWSTFLEPV